ncbi:hypothetical protein B0H63DRAFT_522914 [Podospora didyma]|uniref:Uncharacterized protein n=1 Tax=Podospora didyma TaxID=330526 RepID=A0AAE0NQA3_9PEZI|nr:hypothetical protein B0H63DRAFT_522914 [Podospora didyma]
MANELRRRGPRVYPAYPIRPPVRRDPCEKWAHRMEQVRLVLGVLFAQVAGIILALDAPKLYEGLVMVAEVRFHHGMAVYQKGEGKGEGVSAGVDEGAGGGMDDRQGSKPPGRGGSSAYGGDVRARLATSPRALGSAATEKIYAIRVLITVLAINTPATSRNTSRNRSMVIELLDLLNQTGESQRMTTVHSFS